MYYVKSYQHPFEIAIWEDSIDEQDIVRLRKTMMGRSDRFLAQVHRVNFLEFDATKSKLVTCKTLKEAREQAVLMAL